jgi:hypothetical protein
MWETPEDETHIAKHLVSVRTIVPDPMFDESFNKRNLFVADEDRYVIEDVDPMIWTEEKLNELLVPADKQIAAYRDYIRRWESNGWRIDSRTVEANRDRIAYAIPSPARRTSGNWVLGTVPLVGVESRVRVASG